MNDAPDRTRRAFLGLAPPSPAAQIGPACLCMAQVLCEACRDVCPSNAIRWQRARGSVPRPLVSPSACTGCGECVSVCPTGAISIAGANA